MIKVNEVGLLEDFRKSKEPTSTRFSRKKKKKNESYRDYIFRKSNYTCEYCRFQYPKTKLRLVQVEPTKVMRLHEKYLCCCEGCGKEKGTKSHTEYIHYIQTRIRQIRQEIADNYPAIACRVFERYNKECIYCKAEYGFMPKGKRLTIDHKKPVIWLGTNFEKNLCCACEEHNLDKGSLYAKDYFDVIQFRKKLGIDFFTYFEKKGEYLKKKFEDNVREEIELSSHEEKNEMNVDDHMSLLSQFANDFHKKETISEEA